jgi:hypothetical protein
MPLLSRMLAAAKLYQVIHQGTDGAEEAGEILGNVRFGTQPFLDMIVPASKDIETVSRVIGQ